MRLIRDLQRKKKVAERKKIAKNIALGTFVGSMLGGAAGLLFAPDSGKNTRKKIQEGAVDAKTTVEKNIGEAKTHIEQNISHRKLQIKEAVNKVRQIGKSENNEVAACNESQEAQLPIGENNE
ncbi:MAG: YtxH domain-containing protein [Thermotaleaceae bacterium]